MLKSFTFDLLLNFSLMAAACAMFVAQFLKIFYYFFKEKKLDLSHFLEAGGMPSGHAATVTALTLSVGMSFGFSSPFFAIALIFSLIVMYDAAGVRRAASEQALFLNKIAKEVKFFADLNNYEKLREVLGHTPLEVCVGATIGVLVTFLVYVIYFII